MEMFDQEQYMLDLRQGIKVDEVEERIDSMILEREEVSLIIQERLAMLFPSPAVIAEYTIPRNPIMELIM